MGGENGRAGRRAGFLKIVPAIAAVDKELAFQ